MGTLLRAICNKCGFERERIFFGGTRNNFTTVCAVPAIDLNTNKFVVENYKNKEQLKGSILFYTEHELYKGEIVTDPDSPDWINDTVEFGSAVLKTTENKCPECNNFSMEFEQNGKFD